MKNEPRVEKRDLAALIDNEKGFRTLIERSSDVIQLVTPESKILFTSDSVVNALGYTPEEIEGAIVIPFIHPDDLPGFLKKWKRFLEKPNNQMNTEHRVKHKNGEWVWIEIAFTNHLENPLINAVVKNFRNINDRKKSEAELKKQLELNSVITKNATLGLFVMDKNQRCKFMNPAAEKITGFNIEELQGKPLHQFIHHTKPDGSKYPLEECPIDRASLECNLMKGEEVFIHKDGSFYNVTFTASPILDKGQAIGTVLEVRDTTDEIKLSEEKQKLVDQIYDSEARLRFMAESMPQKVFTAKPDGKLDYLNPQWEQYTGLDFDTIINSGWDKISHAEDKKEFAAKWQYSINSGEAFEMEQRLRRHDGEYRWHICRAHALRDDGNIIMWIGSNTDIHDIKLTIQREHKLKLKSDNLAEQHRQLIEINNAKDEFISLASHQLRTPATTVKQYLGMTLEGYAGELNSEQRAFFLQAYESNERQIAIVNDLLKVAQIDAGKVRLIREPINVAMLVKDILDEYKAIFNQRKQEIIFNTTDESIIATIDKKNFRMVLENIIDNASKYTPLGKTINVDIKKINKLVDITIQDSGVGIAKSDIKKLFNKFSRIENPLSVIVGGTGLGLYWAKKVVDLHGGCIEVNSKVGSGSTFTIQIPA